MIMNQNVFIKDIRHRSPWRGDIDRPGTAPATACASYRTLRRETAPAAVCTCDVCRLHV